jgi:hypothetical protein
MSKPDFSMSPFPNCNFYTFRRSVIAGIRLKLNNLAVCPFSIQEAGEKCANIYHKVLMTRQQKSASGWLDISASLDVRE